VPKQSGQTTFSVEIASLAFSGTSEEPETLLTIRMIRLSELSDDIAGSKAVKTKNLIHWAN
jgi:hypothetical protein